MQVNSNVGIKMKKLNWQIIKSNISEAKQELEKLESQIESGKKPDLVELQISLQHAYHHINFAWNVRNKTLKEYQKFTDKDFKKFGKYPIDICKSILELTGLEEK